MSGALRHLLDLSPLWVVLVGAALVFAEDALFVGFVVPGETAAVLVGVEASRGRVPIVVACAAIVVAAIVGDVVGYAIGRRFGPRLLRTRWLASRSERIDRARAFLAERGGPAVLLARLVAFLRAVVPALAGASRMRVRTFLLWDVLGGLLWGVAFTLVGYLAGSSYRAVASRLGAGAAVVAAVIVVLGIVVWRVRRRRHDGPGASASAA